MIPSFNDIRSYVEAAFSAPWWALSALFSFVICLALRRSKKFPNDAIPLVCVLLCSILTMLTAPGAPISFRAFGWRITNFMIGGILGFIVWQVHAQVLKRLATKFPWLDWLLHGSNGDEPTNSSTPTQAGTTQEQQSTTTKP